ncbi:MAG: secondary thiamine-phosphate synthase enzyme YjbQ [Methanomassiliicoccales archaeon]|jgi:secondary thiamine-phosphate synthase enzyme
METYRKVLELRTEKEGSFVDLTPEVRDAVATSGIGSGLACVFVPHSTAAIFTIENEPGLQKDMREALQRSFPKGIDYEHHRTWNDGNGHSHVRASFLGPSVTVPFFEGDLQLGTWQQVVLMELDNGARNRTVIIQVIGERRTEVKK